MIYEGQILDQTYKIINQIGHGGTSVVYFAYHLRLEKYVVVKQIIGISDLTQLRTEVDILKNLRHQNLPQVYDFICHGSEVYTVMDYVDGQDLDRLLRNRRQFTQEELVKWLNQMADVLIYLHNRTPAVIHSDIKPGNIIITPENNAVLIDFNVSLSRQTDTVIGLSVDYASPEQINLMQQIKKGIWTGERLDGRSDIYSLCATFYSLMCGRHPSVFFGQTPLLQQQTEYDPILCAIIDKGMAAEREDRYQTAEELKKALNTMWRRSTGFKLYMVLQALVILLSASLVALGVNKLITGVRENEHNAFISEYNRVIQVLNHGEAGEAISAAFDFRNSYRDELAEEPGLMGEFLYGFAGRQLEQEDYEDAAENYFLAAECYGPEDPLKVECYAGAAVSLVRGGDIGGGESVLREAESEGVEGEHLALLEVQVLSLEGKSEECVEKAGPLVAETGDATLAARAAIAAALVSVGQERVSWLEKAWDSGTYDLDCIRQIGYEALAAGSEAEAIRKTSLMERGLNLADACYREVCRDEEAGLTDYLNRCTALRLLGRWQEALDVLDMAEENSKIPEEMKTVLYMQRAFVYDEKGDSVRARGALREAAPLLEGGGIRQEERDRLCELMKKYDV